MNTKKINSLGTQEPAAEQQPTEQETPALQLTFSVAQSGALYLTNVDAVKELVEQSTEPREMTEEEFARHRIVQIRKLSALGLDVSLDENGVTISEFYMCDALLEGLVKLVEFNDQLEAKE